MTYNDIMKYFPKFLAGKNDLQQECTHIIFGKEYTAATNGYCLIVSDYVANTPHCEDKNGKVTDMPVETLESKVDKTLNSGKSNIITTCTFEEPRSWFRAFNYLYGECYIQLGSPFTNIYQADYATKKHIQLSSYTKNMSYGGAFNCKWIAEALWVMIKTSAATEKYTISITKEKYPLLIIQNSHMQYLMTGLSKIHGILDDWLNLIGVRQNDNDLQNYL